MIDRILSESVWVDVRTRGVRELTMQTRTQSAPTLPVDNISEEDALKSKTLTPRAKDPVPPTVPSIDIQTCPEEFVLRLIRKEGSSHVRDILLDTAEGASSRKFYFRDVPEAFTQDGLEAIRKLADRILSGESVSLDESNIKIVSALYGVAHRSVTGSELTPEAQVRVLKDVASRSQLLLQKLTKGDELYGSVAAIADRISFYYRTYLKEDAAHPGTKLDEMKFPLQSHPEGGLKLLAFQLAIAERIMSKRRP